TEAGLADPAGPHDRHQPGLAEERAQLAQLVLAPDERGQAGGQVAGVLEPVVLARPHGDLRAALVPELVEDVLDVALDRPLGDEQAVADVAIRQSLRDQRRHLTLAPRKLHHPSWSVVA